MRNKATLIALLLLPTASAETVWEMAERAGAMHGLPPGLMSALVYQESRGNQAAISHAGAIGLAQLMPGTAQSLGVNPYDAWQNVFGGSKYLAQQLRRFNGDLNLALAAYNAGPGRIISAGYRVPRIAETQDYVVKVNHYYRHGHPMRPIAATSVRPMVRPFVRPVAPMQALTRTQGGGLRQLEILPAQVILLEPQTDVQLAPETQVMSAEVKQEVAAQQTAFGAITPTRKRRGSLTLNGGLE